MEYHVKRVNKHVRFRPDIWLLLTAMAVADVLLILYTTDTIVPADFLHVGIVTTVSVLLVGGVVFSGARYARRHKH